MMNLLSIHNDLAVKEDDSRTVKLMKGILERFVKMAEKLVVSLHL